MSNNVLKSIIDPDYPLIDKFKESVPGTYRHSVTVMGFCESIADELDLDVDILRVSAIYHDIGKMNNPEVFGENQANGNIHDDLDPIVSYNLITRHVGDGVLILLQIKDLPHEVLEIVSQHHGNTVLQYFYSKSKSKIDDVYRYKTKSPQSIEAAVLMICDSVEATVKGLHNNGKMVDFNKKKKGVVDNTIRRLVDDNQLDEMRVGDLKAIKRILYRELNGLYHKREVYDDDKTVKEAKVGESFSEEEDDEYV